MNEIALDINGNEGASPLISVAMPVYNCEKYLAEAINSILAQTFTDFELIIIDDGSTDNSLQVLQEFQQKDARIRLVSRENKNVAATLNEIISLARGKWIARMDQDDIALPQRFERQLQWLEQTGADICGSWVRRFGTLDNRIVNLKQSDEAIKMEMLFCSPFAHPTVMVRTIMIKELLYDEIRPEAEDYDLWVRAAVAGWKMANIPEVLLLYRVHPQQVSTKKANRQKQLSEEIRRKYWYFVFHTKRSKEWIDDTLKVFDYPLSAVEIDVVDASFASLLQDSHGEARDVVFDHATRFYFRVAASCPNIVSRWDKLSRDFGNEIAGRTKFKLRLFRLLRIRTDSPLFKQLRKIYIWKTSR